MPVLISGGLHTAEQARAAFEHTGAAGVLLARGSLGNPWLFEQLLGPPRAEPDRDEILAELDWVIERAVEHLGDERATRYLRKFYPWYVERLGRRCRRPAQAPALQTRCRALGGSGRPVATSRAPPARGRQNALARRTGARLPTLAVAYPARARRRLGRYWRVRASGSVEVGADRQRRRVARAASSLCVLVARARARSQPYGTNDYGGFRNILPPGTNGLDDAPQLAQYEANQAAGRRTTTTSCDVLEPDHGGAEHHRRRRSRTSTRTRRSASRPATSRAARAPSRGSRSSATSSSACPTSTATPAPS